MENQNEQQNQPPQRQSSPAPIVASVHQGNDQTTERSDRMLAVENPFGQQRQRNEVIANPAEVIIFTLPDSMQQSIFSSPATSVFAELVYLPQGHTHREVDDIFSFPASVFAELYFARGHTHREVDDISSVSQTFDR